MHTNVIYRILTLPAKFNLAYIYYAYFIPSRGTNIRRFGHSKYVDSPLEEIETLINLLQVLRYLQLIQSL